MRVCRNPGIISKFIYISHVSGPAHSGVPLILSKAPFLVVFPFLKPKVHFHVYGVCTLHCTMEENIPVNDHLHMFSFHQKKKKHSMRVTFVKIHARTIFQNIHFKTTCSCWTTAYFQRLIFLQNQIWQNQPVLQR